MHHTQLYLRRGICIGLSFCIASAMAQGLSRMNYTARGSFTVEMKPLGEPDDVAGVSLGRMSLSKQFEGELVGTGKGEMLTVLTPVKGSAGYVAVERVDGALKGLKGTFAMQHSGTMHEGAQKLAISIVPGSGTGELRGIEGVFKLVIADGKHMYELEYTLPR